MKFYRPLIGGLLPLLFCGLALAGQAAAETTRYLAFQIFTGAFDSAEMRQSLPPPPDSLLKTVQEMRGRVYAAAAAGRRLGFIPTFALDPADQPRRPR